MLIDLLPLAIPVSGRSLHIETNFRTGILFELMVQDGEIPDNEKIEYAVDLFFPDEFPSSAEEQKEAIDGMIWFYSCGDPPKEKSKDQAGGGLRSGKGIEKQIYDYEYDAPLIYAAFLSQYGVDLQDIKYLHWWKFVAMFRGLSDNQRIVEVMGYRSMNLSKIKNRAEREHYAALQAKYALPDRRSTEEKIAAAGALFGGMFR